MIIINTANIARPPHRFAFPTKLISFSPYWKWQVRARLTFFRVAIPTHPSHICIAYITIWCLSRLSSSSDPAFLSLAVFDLVVFCALSLIFCLKLGDVITNSGSRRGPWDFSAKYDYLTARPWTEEDYELAKTKLAVGDLTMNLTWDFFPFLTFLQGSLRLVNAFSVGSYSLALWSFYSSISPLLSLGTRSLLLRYARRRPSLLGRQSLFIVRVRIWRPEYRTSGMWSLYVNLFKQTLIFRSNFWIDKFFGFLQGRPTVVGSNLTDDSPSLASAVEVVLLSNGSNSKSLPFYIPYFILHVYQGLPVL